MKSLILLIAFLAASGVHGFGETLKEMYDKAPSAYGYDRYIELETGVIYTGGLYIGKAFNRITARFDGEDGEDVMIAGNGAILDLKGQEICISYCENKLDIVDCIVLNGNIRFRGIDFPGFKAWPLGSVRYVTFYKPHDYGVRLFGCGQDIQIERCIVVDAVCTGPGFMYLNGCSNDWLPTGSSIAFSAFFGTYGMPYVADNWSYHHDPDANADPERHFCLLCEYG